MNEVIEPKATMVAAGPSRATARARIIRVTTGRAGRVRMEYRDSVLLMRVDEAVPNKFDYVLRLAPDAVRARLAAAADLPRWRYWWLPGTTQGRPIIGEATADGFWWRMRHKERASPAPWLSGQISALPSGSKVAIELHSPLTGRARIVIGVAITVLGLVWIVSTPNPNILNLLVAAVAILAVPLFPIVGTRLYAGERRRLREEFERTFVDQIQADGRNST